MKVKMTKTQTGSNNGISIKKYEKDQEYEMGEDLGNVFLKMGVCEMIPDDPDDKEKSKKKKADSKSPKNKMMSNSYSNKDGDDDDEDDNAIFNKLLDED